MCEGEVSRVSVNRDRVRVRVRVRMSSFLCICSTVGRWTSLCLSSVSCAVLSCLVLRWFGGSPARSFVSSWDHDFGLD